jgi:NAD(P)-dependent dehydrogenase (short-subunit alcohol dehydrogenase family)
MDLSLRGKVAFVTGAARGIGKAIALRLASEGASVALIDIAAESLAATADEIRTAGHRAIALPCNVADHAAVGHAVARTRDEFGAIDILVNNAGIVSRKPIIEVPPEEWQRVLDTNLGGAFNSIQHIGRVMVAAGRGGRIVNISSIHGHIARANMASYCASKAAIDMLTKQLAVELAPHGIAVNAVACGAIATEINFPLYKSTAPADVALRTATLRRIPAGAFGDPDDVANAVAFLASATAARYVTGAILYVDGGYVADGTVRWDPQGLPTETAPN